MIAPISFYSVIKQQKMAQADTNSLMSHCNEWRPLKPQGTQKKKKKFVNASSVEKMKRGK